MVGDGEGASEYFFTLDEPMILMILISGILGEFLLESMLESRDWLELTGGFF